MDVLIYGADSETIDGQPLSLQFFSKDVKDCEHIVFVDHKSSQKQFFKFLGKLQRECLHVFYVHNLDFDLPEFLWRSKTKLVENGSGEFKFKSGPWNVSGVYGKPTFCKLVNKQRKATVMFVDSFSWYQGSLANAAELFCPNLPKLKAPPHLGSIKYTAKDQAFVKYAMRDAEVCYYIGKAIQKIHTQFDIPQAVSLADMAARIFRRKFLDYTIPQPGAAVVAAALKSYHGGKNHVRTGAKGAWHEHTYAYDISSAYPFAMTRLPSMRYKNLYKRYAKKVGTPARRIKRVPELGVYQVSGEALPCEYPCLFSHAFKPLQGKFTNVWIHGLEVNEALRAKELKIKSIRGHYYEAEKDKDPSAFQEFVDHFYKLKQTEREPVMRHMYKITLNAVYGKFIQTRKSTQVSYTDVDSGETIETQELVAGGMFHPFIASFITAHCRVYIHRAEHQYKAIHTATDGIISYQKTLRPVPGYPKRGLGALECEGKDETLLLVRNKCYIRYSRRKPKGAKKPIKSTAFKGQYIIKYALHGFQGKVYTLETLVMRNRRKYFVERPNRLKESINRGLRVNRFERREYTLKVPPIAVARRGQKTA